MRTTATIKTFLENHETLYRLRERDRQRILSQTPAALEGEIGISSILASDIEQKRINFILRYGNQFGTEE